MDEPLTTRTRYLAGAGVVGAWPAGACAGKYVADWDANVARSKNAEQMKKNLAQLEPHLPVAEQKPGGSAALSEQ